jgi:dolichol-phosphate mannosyltransferase
MNSKDNTDTSDLSSVKVAVVVPAYRVGNKIVSVLENMPPFVHDVIVVDDCSPESVNETIRPYLSSRVHVVRHHRNTGVGGAMLTGYSIAVAMDADVVAKVDGDDQMDLSRLSSLILPIVQRKADYTKGNRFMHGYALRQMSIARRIGNLGLSFLTKIATGYWDIFDPSNGYTAIHSEVLRLINTNVIARDYFFESSMLLELSRLRAVVLDMPIPARYQNEITSLSEAKVLMTFPLRLVRGYLRRLKLQYFLYDFSPASALLLLGVPLLLFGVAFGAWHWYLSYTTEVVATTGTVLLAVLPIILGVQFLAQALVLDIARVPHRVLHSNVISPEEKLTHKATLSWYPKDYDVIY